MELKNNALLPLLVMLVTLGTFPLYAAPYQAETSPLEKQTIKADIVSSMQINLLKAIEAEKNAVLAITDEESAAFAAKSREASNNVENNRKEFEAIIHLEELPDEAGLINEFNACWVQYRKLDEKILDLAVQNTNLKAQKISATQCAQEIELLDSSLNKIIQQNKDGQCSDTVRFAHEVLTASLKIFALHKTHIEEADDAQMDKIEQNIILYDESAKKAFKAFSGIAELNKSPDLKTAQAAYDKFMTLTGEILKLSRMNTNIKSAAISLDKKRLVSAQCQEILTTLQKKVQARGNYSLPKVKKGNSQK